MKQLKHEDRKSHKTWSLDGQRTQAQQTHRCVQHQRAGMKPRYQSIKLKAK